MICRSFVDHASRFLIFSQIRSPIRKITSASGMSERTSVAKRGLNKLKPNAPSAMTPATFPYTRDALRNKRSAIAAAQRNGGKRHAMSHDRVTEKVAADIQPVSGGLVARP